MINIDDHFIKGSSGYETTSQALAEINRARQTGDPRLVAEADRLEVNLEAAIFNAKKSKGKDFSGFNAVVKSVGGLSSMADDLNKSQLKSQQSASRISALLGNVLGSGAKVDQTLLTGISNAISMNDSDALAVHEKTLEEIQKAQIQSGSKAQDKPLAQKEELTPFEQGRVQDLAAMKTKSQGKFEDNEQFTQEVVSKLSDPNEYGKLVTETKKREMVETQARKIFRRLQAARELYASPELMNEFGDTKPTQLSQALFTTGDNALHKALLGQLKGGDLAQGMAEVKAATGTAAGMAVEETKALANSISALDQDLAPEDAQKKVLQIINDAKFALERLGIDPELIKDKKSGDRVLANEIKYLLPDERSYHMGGSDTLMGKSGSGISSSEERLRSLTPQINQSSRTRIVPER